MSKTFLFQAIQFSQIVLIQTIPFSISMQHIYIQPLDRAQSGVTIPGQSGPGSNGIEGVLRIPESPGITGTSPSDFLVSYLGHSLEEFYPSTEVQSVYSTAQADWAKLERLRWLRNIFQLKYTLHCNTIQYLV